MRRILDRLMFSSLSEANDPFFLSRHDVQAILYFGDGGMFPEDIKLYHRPALEDGSLNPELLRDGVLFLKESLAAGRRVLAVGSTGGTMVAAYLTEMGFSSAQALEMVTEEIEVDADSIDAHAERLRLRSEIKLH